MKIMNYGRPMSVPRLNLQTLNDNLTAEKETKIVEHKPSLMSPTSRSDVSWGTPLSSPYHVNKRDIVRGNTALRPCKHIMHPQTTSQQQQQHVVAKQQQFHQKQPTTTQPQKQSVHYEEKHEQESHEKTRKQTPKKEAVKKDSYWYLDDEHKDKPPTPKPSNTGPTVDELAQMQASYTQQAYSDMHSARKMAAEEDLALKQRQEVMEQVLADQLCQHVISDPEQDRDPMRANPADPFRQTMGVPMAPIRNRSRRLHDTKVSTVGAATETNLQQRVTFFARVVTSNGRDAMRELFGFLFMHDGTVTLYEFRIFGKNNIKALPFISRGAYKHQVGRRKGKRITTADIRERTNLSFSTAKLNLPDTIKKVPIVTVRITTVDGSNVTDDRWSAESSDRDMAESQRLERDDAKVLKKVQDQVRGQLRSNSVSVLLGLGRLFRNLDTSGDGLLSKDELKQALLRFDVTIPERDFESVWRVVDENDDGAIDYGEFMRAFIGEMSEFRKSMVRKVFRKLDPHKTGSANILDLKKLYSAKLHPMVMSGQYSQSEMEERFVASFTDDWSRDKSQVSYVSFVDYYEGLSICVASDNDFANMMRNCWGV